MFFSVNLFKLANKMLGWLTDFLNFIECTKLSKNTVLVSRDVTGLYTNIPHKESINTVCNHGYKDFYRDKAPVTHQVPKGNALSYINRKLVPILR